MNPKLILIVIVVCALLYVGYKKYTYTPIPNTPVPIPDSTLLPIDPVTGVPIDPETQAPIIDPETNAPIIDPVTNAPIQPTPIPYQPIMGRYIKLLQPSPGGFNVGEIMAFAVPNDGVNIINSGMTVTSSPAGKDPGAHVIDGNLNTFFDAFGQPNGNEFVQVDMGEMKSIGMVRVYNRQSCCQQRLNGSILIIMDDTLNVVYHSDPLMDTSGSTVYDDQNQVATYNNYSFILPSPTPIPSQIN